MAKANKNNYTTFAISFLAIKIILAKHNKNANIPKKKG